jgi:hypothetical protein
MVSPLLLLLLAFLLWRDAGAAIAAHAQTAAGRLPRACTVAPKAR